MIPRRRIHIQKSDLAAAFKALSGGDGLLRRVTEWEEAFARYIGARHAVSTGSGRSGMALILGSLGLVSGDEVIVPSYTLKDLIPVIRSLGLKVVLADIDPRTFNADPASIEKAVTPRSRVLLATHLFGNPCSIGRILEIAQKNSLFIVEDCAHALGSEFNGRKAGSFGDAAFFSFDTLKLINTYGGGMVTTRSEALAEKIRAASRKRCLRSAVPYKKMAAATLENLFLPSPVSFLPLSLLASKGLNAGVYALYRKTQRLSGRASFSREFQALVGSERLKTLEARIDRRREAAFLLRSFLDDRFSLQHSEPGARPNHYFFVVSSRIDAWRVRRALLWEGIDAGVGSEIADDCSLSAGEHFSPNSRQVFQGAIQLPLYESLSFDRIAHIGRTLKNLKS